jgi:hypothetical protein
VLRLSLLSTPSATALAFGQATFTLKVTRLDTVSFIVLSM